MTKLKMSVKERLWLEQVDTLKERNQMLNDTIRDLNKVIYNLSLAAGCCTECSLCQ